MSEDRDELGTLLFNLESASVAHVRGAANRQEVLAARAAIVAHRARELLKFCALKHEGLPCGECAPCRAAALLRATPPGEPSEARAAERW